MVVWSKLHTMEPLVYSWDRGYFVSSFISTSIRVFMNYFRLFSWHLSIYCSYKLHLFSSRSIYWPNFLIFKKQRRLTKSPYCLSVSPHPDFVRTLLSARLCVLTYFLVFYAVRVVGNERRQRTAYFPFYHTVTWIQKMSNFMKSWGRAEVLSHLFLS
jgi:hypothetical protein